MNVSGLNFPNIKDTDWWIGFKKRPNGLLPTRNTLYWQQNKRKNKTTDLK
jgi:hypothetical protein